MPDGVKARAEHSLIEPLGKPAGSSPARRAIETLFSASGRLARDLAHFVLPPLCLACRRPVGTAHCLCPLCWGEMHFIERPYCERLGLPFADALEEGAVSAHALAFPPAYERGRAVAIYDGVARDIVHHFKFRDQLDLAKPMGSWMARAGQELLKEADFLVPMPLHRWRLLQRRYNQSALLAREIGRLSARRVLTQGLLRIRHTKRQVGLDRAARQENVQGAFRVPPDIAGLIRGSRVLLIDDVLTSGASVDAATRALKRAGAAEVDVLVFCRVAIGDSEFIS